jgi:hypothetical protein
VRAESDRTPAAFRYLKSLARHGTGVFFDSTARRHPSFAADWRQEVDMVSRTRRSTVVQTVVPALLLGAAFAGTPGAARATLITDAVNDFIPSFLGPKNSDLDVVKAEVTFDGTTFVLHAVLNGPAGTTPGGFYVWGFNRGAGTQGFPTIAPGVVFDQVVVLRTDGTSAVAGTPIPVTISGNEIFGRVPANLLPSTGFAPFDYKWNLWPRSPTIPGNANGNIADFAPDNSDAAVTAVPAPPSFVLLAQGGLVLAAAIGLRRRVVAFGIAG